MAKTRIQRFPRIPELEHVGEMAKAIWKRPRFSARETAHSTEFKLKLGFSLRKRAKDESPAIHQMLFEDQRLNWSQELVKAYGAAKYKGLAVSKVCDGALYQVFLRALQNVFEKARHSGARYAEYLGGEPGDLVKSAHRVRRPNRAAREQRAICLARRYRELKPEVSALRKFVETQKDLGKSELLSQIEKRFKNDWVPYVINEMAIRHLPEIPVHARSVDSLGSLEWTVRQLTVGIMKCEEDHRGEKPSLGATTILEKYIPLGNRLLRRPSGNPL
jgi:hypothetical protein